MRALTAMALGITFSIQAFSSDVRLITEDLFPMNFVENDKPTGPAVEIVEAIKKKLKLKTPIEVLPWPRAYDLVQKEANIAVFAASRTEQRETMFKWVGPLGSKDWVFIKKKSSSVKIRSLNDAKKVKAIGTYREDSKEQFLKSQGFTNLDSLTTDSANAKKLASGRIDLWLTGKLDYVHSAKAENVDPNELEVAFTVKRQPVYMLFSKQTDDALVKKWQDAYDQLAKEGTILKIQDKYGINK